jgi:6-phosphogluconolactonase
MCLCNRVLIVVENRVSQVPFMLELFADPTALAQAAAMRFVAICQAACASHGRWSVALAGGSTPRGLYQLLANDPWRSQIDWSRGFVFWGDERFVPPDDGESLLGLARTTLLDHVPIPPDQIVPFPTVGLSLAEAAAIYEQQLLRFGAGQTPQFDLVLLGMGPDGHTASLFPGHPEAEQPSDRLAIAVTNAPKPPPDRLSLTYRTLNAARHMLFLVTGADKAETLAAVLEGPPNRSRLPAQGVQPVDGTLIWMVDQAAAQRLALTTRGAEADV